MLKQKKNNAEMIVIIRIVPDLTIFRMFWISTFLLALSAHNILKEPRIASYLPSVQHSKFPLSVLGCPAAIKESMLLSKEESEHSGGIMTPIWEKERLS